MSEYGRRNGKDLDFAIDAAMLPPTPPDPYDVARKDQERRQAEHMQLVQISQMNALADGSRDLTEAESENFDYIEDHSNAGMTTPRCPECKKQC